MAIVNAANEPDTVYEVIGVVRNQKYQDIRESLPLILYTASSQTAARADAPLPGAFDRHSRPGDWRHRGAP